MFYTHSLCRTADNDYCHYQLLADYFLQSIAWSIKSHKIMENGQIDMSKFLSCPTNSSKAL